ncbi:hypothetical protein AY599_18235 [Leptolyngbya valderiana BDU 20041]|nr:hypothetical protein AY599_18235 [Leptolyngbya valderiana BDU 20041]
MTALLSACATGDPQARLDMAARQQADASLAVAAARRAARIPEWPADCRRHERTGVEPGDRLDVAALKGDQAVGRGNARIDRCAAWYDDLKESRETAP